MMPHGDLLVMLGECQDEFVHYATPDLATRRLLLFGSRSCERGGRGNVGGRFCFRASTGGFFIWFVDQSFTLSRREQRRWTREVSQWEIMDPNKGRGESNAKKAACDCWVTPYMFAFGSLPTLFGSDTCVESAPKGAPWGRTRPKERETLSSPFRVLQVFLLSSCSLHRSWGLLLCVLWIGRARPHGPDPQAPLRIEVFNVGRCFTHEETMQGFLGVVEHRLFWPGAGVGQVA